MVIFWYTYDNQGNQIWLLGAGSYEGSKATLTVTRTQGALFPPNFNSSDVETIQWGTFEFEVSGCDTAQFNWIPNDEVEYESGSLQMERFAQNAGLTCEE